MGYNRAYAEKTLFEIESLDQAITRNRQILDKIFTLERYAEVILQLERYSKLKDEIFEIQKSFLRVTPEYQEFRDLMRTYGLY